MPQIYKPKVGGYRYNQNRETIKGGIVTISHIINDMTDQMEGIIDAAEAASNLLHKKVNLPYVPPALQALSIIALQMSRFNNRLTKIRNEIGTIVTAAEENHRIVNGQLDEFNQTVDLNELQVQIERLLELLKQ